MNEHGKSFKDAIVVTLSFLCLSGILLPFYEAVGFDIPFSAEIICSLEFAERMFWFMVCSFILVSMHVIGFIVGNVISYAVYFIQRAWYLHKLRKPERIYTGDPL